MKPWQQKQKQRQENTKAHKSFSIGIGGVDDSGERQRREASNKEEACKNEPASE